MGGDFCTTKIIDLSNTMFKYLRSFDVRNFDLMQLIQRINQVKTINDEDRENAYRLLM